MDELDRKIEEALSAEDRALMEHFGEQGLLGQFGSLFSGKLAWLTAITVIAGFGMFILGVYAAWNFINAPDISGMLRWGGVAWFGFISLMMIKIWSWMRMETNRILREVKRLELQIARMKA
ncbi:MAG: hypothetical protein COA69_04170 [Robiginitomaculum sp.]|nr:MAG: hypothetical protein COA69_04170 [Robiginitomaculum sp.]